MIDHREENRIRSRLRMGNSPKRIALDYPDSQGMLTAIEEIKQRMAAERRFGFFAPLVVAKAKPKPWIGDLPLNIGKLIEECCDYCDCDLEDLPKSPLAVEARRMIAHALRHRWAYDYASIGAVLSVGDDTASALSKSYAGPLPVTVPPVPDIDKELLPTLRRVAGEYRTTEYAIINGAGIQGVLTDARQHFTYLLFYDHYWLIADIAKLIGATERHVSVLVQANAKKLGANKEKMDRIRRRHVAARKRSHCHA